MSEVMTIVIQFHLSGYRPFKAHYSEPVLRRQCGEFPDLVSYHRFVELLPASLVALCVYLTTSFGACRGISFLDATPLAVCHRRRIWGRHVFADYAARGKTSVDWFYGFKLHLAVNTCGELLNVTLTAGKGDDRAVAPDFVAALFGQSFGDKGSVSQPLFEQLWADGVQLITKLKKNMKERLWPPSTSWCCANERLVDQLKNIPQIEHLRHRSVDKILCQLTRGLRGLHLAGEETLPAFA